MALESLESVGMMIYIRQLFGAFLGHSRGLLMHFVTEPAVLQVFDQFLAVIWTWGMAF